MKNKSIDRKVLLKKQIKASNEKLKKSSDHSFRNLGLDFYQIYTELVNGNRERYYSKISEAEKAGKTEGLQKFIEYLENSLTSTLRKDSVTNISSKIEINLLPIDLFKKTRGYLEKNVCQVNICYKHGAFDGCFVLLRKILEILIIESLAGLFQTCKVKKNLKISFQETYQNPYPK
jgi:hypothetical protein